MATQENSVQFSLKELVTLESDRRRDEDARARQREEEALKARVEAELKAHRLVVEEKAKQAAERAASKARLEAEQMLATERARISAEEKRSTITLQPAAPRRSNAWLGLAAMVCSVLGLGTSLAYLATQPTVAAVRVLEQPISITQTEKLAAPVEPILIAKEEPAGEPKKSARKKPENERKKPKEVKQPACDYRKDPLCGALINGYQP